MNPNLSTQLADALADLGHALGDGLTTMARTLSAQAAIGWLLHNEPDQAREALAALPADQLATIAAAARQLQQLAYDLTHPR